MVPLIWPLTFVKGLGGAFEVYRVDKGPPFAGPYQGTMKLPEEVNHDTLNC